jgi:hypothetical protein
MGDVDGLGFDGLEGDEAVLLNGCRQHTISLVVDVLADDVDSTGSSRDVVRFALVMLREFMEEDLVTGGDWGGIVGLKGGVGYCLDH